MGLVRPSDLGLRAALIADTMPPDTLTGAMGFNRVTSDSARIAGALTGAGLVALLGHGPCLCGDCDVLCARRAAHLAGGIPRIQRRRPCRWWRPSPGGCRPGPICAKASCTSGTRRACLAIICFVLLFNLFAFPLTNGLLPYVAREVYRVDQAGLSYLIASISLGAMLGGFLMSRVDDRQALAPDDRLRHRLASAAVAVRADAKPGRRNGRAALSSASRKALRWSA